MPHTFCLGRCVLGLSMKNAITLPECPHVPMLLLETVVNDAQGSHKFVEPLCFIKNQRGVNEF